MHPKPEHDDILVREMVHLGDVFLPLITAVGLLSSPALPLRFSILIIALLSILFISQLPFEIILARADCVDRQLLVSESLTFGQYIFEMLNMLITHFS